MVNGTLSRILYVGAFVLTGICVVGYIILAMLARTIPGELAAAFTASLALIAGSHITPPNVQRTIDGSGYEPGATYTAKDGQG